MSDNRVRRAWEERIISQEKGKRLVHYILRDSTGNSLLAGVGRDRCLNHMSYSVSEDFLRVFGSTNSVNGGSKWGARRDVVEWLASVASIRGPILNSSTKSSSLKCQGSLKSNNGQSSSEEPSKQASKRIKSCDEGVKPINKRLKFKFLSKIPAVTKLVVPVPHGQELSKFSEYVELFSQDSGTRGCWFRCKILHSSQNCLKVQYKDVLEVDGHRQLEEWVPAAREAMPDKLGIRFPGRLTLRPFSSEDSSSNNIFTVGAAVDAWWCNGWWEGVVIGNECDTSNLQVYFPDEKRFLTVARKNIRVSKDWINCKWVNVKAKRDILSFLSSIFSNYPKTPSPRMVADADIAAPGNGEVVDPQKLEGSEDDGRLVKPVVGFNPKKRFISRYNEELSSRNSN